MNLSPLWVGFLVAHGMEAVHWSAIGSARAPDTALLDWAGENGHLVLTHDLDFSALIALAGLSGPSVVHVRSQRLLPAQIGTTVVDEDTLEILGDKTQHYRGLVFHFVDVVTDKVVNVRRSLDQLSPFEAQTWLKLVGHRDKEKLVRRLQQVPDSSYRLENFVDVVFITSREEGASCHGRLALGRDT